MGQTPLVEVNPVKLQAANDMNGVGTTTKLTQLCGTDFVLGPDPGKGKIRQEKETEKLITAKRAFGQPCINQKGGNATTFCLPSGN